jgi:thiamine biosynthesis lipoprotein
VRNLATVPADQEATRRVRAEPLMGTVIAIDVRDRGIAEEVLDSVFAWFHEVDARFSTFRSDSEVSRIGRGELRVSDCTRDVREVLFLCEEVRRISEGCFDIWQGGRCDPSALVKGWSVERASLLLKAAGARNYFINAGGDIVASGRRRTATGGWASGIPNRQIASPRCCRSRTSPSRPVGPTSAGSTSSIHGAETLPPASSA